MPPPPWKDTSPTRASWPLLRATADPVRLVRIRAAAALASVHPEQIDNRRRAKIASPGDGRVQEGHGGAARRLGLVFEPWQLRHGKRRLRRGGRGLRDGPEAGAPRGRAHGQLVDGLCQLEAERQGRGLAPPRAEGRTGQRRGQLQPGPAAGRGRNASTRPRRPCGRR